ncbi:MAG: methyltransferase [Clostridia bacterium]|nr:methyltransferase [Clostridia bacterium]
MKEVPQSPSLLPDERLDRVNEELYLIQKQNGLTFGTDAYLLAAFLRPSPNAFAVDLGSGTGIISLLALAKNKFARVTAVEIQQGFADLIARNAAVNGYAERLTPMLCDVRKLSPALLGREADVVFSNPPYMTADSGKRNLFDEKYIARHEVCGGISDFCAAAGRILKHGGKFYCVFRPDRLSELMNALQNARLAPKRMTFVHADADTEPCMLLVEAIKGGAPSVRVSKPLLLYLPKQAGERSRTRSPEAERIYRNCSFLDEPPSDGRE